jgi:holo-[acyl-carrier protein] synthase
MTALKVGTDICSISRIRKTYERYGEKFLDRILTPNEKQYVTSRGRGLVESLAGRFAAKEAVGKALGVGLRGVAWKEIEIGRAVSGAPSVILHGRAKKIAQHLHLNQIEISISHEREFSIALVVATGAP